MTDYLPPAPSEAVLYDIENHIATLTLNSPNNLNALTIPIVQQLQNTLILASHDPKVRVIILTGAGKAFCSGGDIAYMRKHGTSPEAAKSLATRFATTLADLVRTLRHLPKPTIARINGAAAGAGMSLALACDFRVASQDSRFIQAFVNVGLAPDAGGIALLTQLVGPAKATEWTLLGKPIPAQTLLDLGVLYRLTESQDLDSETQALAQHLAALPPIALAKIKETLNLASFQSLEPVFLSEIRNQTLLSQTKDHHEGLQAFLEKRHPKFTGQ